MKSAIAMLTIACTHASPPPVSDYTVTYWDEICLPFNYGHPGCVVGMAFGCDLHVVWSARETALPHELAHCRDWQAGVLDQDHRAERWNHER